MSVTMKLCTVKLLCKEFQLLNSSRMIVTSTVCNHNPGIKKKNKPMLDPKRTQRQKDKQEAKLRKQIITPPVDPDSVPDPAWYGSDRQRPVVVLTEDEKEERVLLQKEWSRYRMKCHISDLKMIREKQKCRADALRELKKESEFLYTEALKVDKLNFPLYFKGPMETPAVDKYEPPDFVDDNKK